MVQQENLQQVADQVAITPDLIQGIWDTTDSWNEMTWLWDWDFMISGGRALRTYLFDFGTVPFWNLFLCGGQPELENPQSFAFTWASLFFYLMPPATAIMALWAVMTAIGSWSVAKLLELASVRSWISWSCSVAYVLSGYFGAHFNQGHATFAFFHLIPLLMLMISRYWFDCQRGALRSRLIPGITIVSFALFSAPAIQAWVYIFPLVILMILALALPSKLRRRVDLHQTGEFLAGVGVSLGLGILAASYKFVPVVFQSLSRRRDDIFSERYSPGLFFRTFFQFVSKPERMWEDYLFPGRIYGWWEYSSFISPLVVMLPVILIFLGIWRVVFLSPLVRIGNSQPSSSAISQTFTRRLKIVAISGIFIGLFLSLGSGHWEHLSSPVPFGFILKTFFQSVRVLPRYQVLALFGMVVLCGLMLETMPESFRLQRSHRIVVVLIALLVAVPSVLQFSYMIQGIRAVSDRDLIRAYKLEAALEQSEIDRTKLLANRFLQMPGILSVQDIFIRKGHIIDECYDPFFPVRSVYQKRSHLYLRPIVSPPVAEIIEISKSSFRLSVSDQLRENLVWNLPMVPEVRFEPQPVLLDEGLSFEPELVGGREINIQFPIDSFRFGFLLSGFALLMFLINFFRKKEA